MPSHPSQPGRAAERVVRAVPLVLAACRRREIRDPAQRVRLSPQLARILDQLEPDRAVTAGELARRLGVTPATVSLQTARLLKQRLVTRSRDAQDGRRVLLRLTEAGARIRTSKTLLDPTCVHSLLQRIPRAERDGAVRGIEALGRAAKTRAAEPPTRRADMMPKPGDHE